MTILSEPNLTTQQMKAVLAVARHRSFVAAAEELAVSQPTLTRIVQSLEEQLGITLFARSTRRVDLTPEGEEFAAVAERLLADLGIVTRRLRDLSGEKRGQVTVATLMTVAQGLLPPVLSRFRATHPGVDVNLREGIEQEIEENLRSGAADFAVAALDRTPDSFTVIPLRREAFHVLLPAGHPLAGRAEIPLKALREETLVSLPVGSRSRQLLDAAAAAEGMVLNYAVTARQFATLQALVRQGLGIAVLSAEAAPDGVGGIVARPLAKPALARELSVIHLTERPPSPAAQALMDLLLAAVRPATETRKRSRN